MKISEQHAMQLWHQLFRGQRITTLTLREAAAVIESLPEDSPVRLRLSAELDELRVKAVTRE